MRFFLMYFEGELSAMFLTTFPLMMSHTVNLSEVAKPKYLLLGENE